MKKTKRKDAKQKRPKQIDLIYSHWLVYYARLNTIGSTNIPSFPLQTHCQYFFETFSIVIIITRFGQENNVFVTRGSRINYFRNQLFTRTTSESITRWAMLKLTTIIVLSLKKWWIFKIPRSAYWLLT